MDVIKFTLIAAAIGWASIVAVIQLPTLPAKPMRIVAALTIALIGFMVIGLPIPSYVPLIAFIGGVMFVIVKPRDAAAAA